MAGRGKRKQSWRLVVEVTAHLILIAGCGAPLYVSHPLVFLLPVSSILIYLGWATVLTLKADGMPIYWRRRTLRQFILLIATLGAIYSVSSLLLDAHQTVLSATAGAFIGAMAALYERSVCRKEDEEGKVLATRDDMSQLLEQTAEQENQEVAVGG